MAKSTVKIKHLGLVSTGKFLAVFWFIFSLVILAIFAVVFGLITLFSTILGLGFGGSDALGGVIVMAGLNIVSFLVMAVVLIIVYPIMGFIVGVIGAFVFNLVVKVSGGLAFDAEIDNK
jgi:hypothetical protein